MTTKYPWYGNILLLLRRKHFKPQLTHDNQRCIRHQAPWDLLMGEILYWRGVDTILCLCLMHDQAEKALNEWHSGACCNHISGMAIAKKLLRVCFFWPTLFHDCIKVVKMHERCQRFVQKSRVPPSPLHTIILAGPFRKWGANLLLGTLHHLEMKNTS